jgi:hypothetical protein
MLSGILCPMAKPVSIAEVPRSSDASDEARSQSMLSAVRTLIRGLSPEEQEQLLSELTGIVRPISAPRAGDVLGAVVRLIPKRRPWTIDDLKKDVEAEGVEASPKEVYNAVGYLVRKGQIRRVGYGRYIVDGTELVTSDDLGGASTRHEDEYRTNRE